MGILANENAISSGGYKISNSLRFQSASSTYMSRTPASNGNRTTFTWSAWVKRGALSSNYSSLLSAGAGAGAGDNIYFNASDQLAFWVAGSTILVTTQVFRDPSAWYHILISTDTTQATTANRIKMYVNGVQITSFGTSTYVAQNYNFLSFTTTTAQLIGSAYTGYFDGYLSEVNFIDGQALTPSSFGSTNATTGVWQPAKYTGTYGTNGFYLNFNSIALTSGSNTGLGKDNSGNGNYWNTNNISVTAGTNYDAMTDVPTNTSATVANYATLNPLAVGGDYASTLSNGNLSVTWGTSGQKPSTIAFTSGFWYMEVALVGTANGGYLGINYSSTNSGTSAGSNAWFYDGSTYVAGSRTSAVLSTWATGATLMLAVNATNGKLYFGQNGTWLGSANPSAGTGANITYTTGSEFIITASSSGNVGTGSANFGQRPFTYTPPTGYVALNTYNLPTPTILQGNKYMDATLYTGNGSTQTITNAGGFKPDLVWVKSRSAATDHKLTDSVRGVQKGLISDTTGAETTDTNGLTAFNSNGWSLGTDTIYNANAGSFVGWQWQAGQGSTSSNTNGSITSTTSVNATAGFSVVTYTGTGANATVGHGLGVAPKMVIVKARTSAQDWVVQHTSLTSGAYTLYLDSTSAQTSVPTIWNSAFPTSTVFSLGTNVLGNSNTITYVAYCFAEISGFSKAFNYTGNGSTDGSFIYCGFLPRFVMLKRTDTTGDWYMWDTARNTYDVITNTLLANSSAAETSATSIDALSNGFKMRNTTAGFNANGGTYIGFAWATNPFQNSNAF